MQNDEDLEAAGEFQQEVTEHVGRMEITVSELAELVDLVHKAVDETKFGPLFQYAEKDGKPVKIVSQACYAVFADLLKGTLAKLDTVRIVPDAPPSDIVTNLD